MEALIIDTETSGLLSSHLMPHDRQPEVIEFCGVTSNLATGEKLSELSMLIRPSKPINAEITAITGITRMDLDKVPPFSAQADAIQQLIENAPLVIAHNASFDKEILDLEFERLKRKLKWPRLLCTVEQTIYLQGFRMSMMELYKFLFNETFKDAHRAVIDVAALVRCCIELHRRNVI